MISLLIACQSTLPVQVAQKQLNINLFKNKNESDNRKYINQIKNDIEKLDIKITNNNYIDLSILHEYENLKNRVNDLENIESNNNNFIVAIESILIAIYSTYKLISSIKNKNKK